MSKPSHVLVVTYLRKRECGERTSKDEDSIRNHQISYEEHSLKSVTSEIRKCNDNAKARAALGESVVDNEAHFYLNLMRDRLEIYKEVAQLPPRPLREEVFPNTEKCAAFWKYHVDYWTAKQAAEDGEIQSLLERAKHGVH